MFYSRIASVTHLIEGVCLYGTCHRFTFLHASHRVRVTAAAVFYTTPHSCHIFSLPHLWRGMTKELDRSHSNSLVWLFDMIFRFLEVLLKCCQHHCDET